MNSLIVSYKNHRFPSQIIAHAVWLYFRFPLSLRLVEEMLVKRGVIVTYETIRRWGCKFGAAYRIQWIAEQLDVPVETVEQFAAEIRMQVKRNPDL